MTVGYTGHELHRARLVFHFFLLQRSLSHKSRLVSRVRGAKPIRSGQGSIVSWDVDGSHTKYRGQTRLCTLRLWVWFESARHFWTKNLAPDCPTRSEGHTQSSGWRINASSTRPSIFHLQRTNRLSGMCGSYWPEQFYHHIVARRAWHWCHPSLNSSLRNFCTSNMRTTPSLYTST